MNTLKLASNLVLKRIYFFFPTSLYSNRVKILISCSTPQIVYRELLTMRYTMNMSYKEMAEELGSNEKAVGKRVKRLVSKCRTIAEELKL